jgi:hypothetical protein
MRFDHCRAHDRERSLRGTARLEREQALSRGLQLRQSALFFTAGCTRPRLFSHVFQPFRIAGRPQRRSGALRLIGYGRSQ